MSSKTVSHSYPMQGFIWHILAMLLTLMPASSMSEGMWIDTATKVGGGESLSYPVDRTEDSEKNNHGDSGASVENAGVTGGYCNSTRYAHSVQHDILSLQCEALRSKKTCHAAGCASCCAERSDVAVPLFSEKSTLHATHSSPPQLTAHAVPTDTKNKYVIPRKASATSSHAALHEVQSQYAEPTRHLVDSADATPHTHNTIISATQALDQLEQRLDQRLRVAATNFTNNAAQGFVQQSLPKMLLGGHWLTEKFQFLSTLAWQTGDDEGGILGELDLVVPLYGMRNAAGVDQYGFFLQPGLVSWEADNGDRRLDVNVGLAYRHLLRQRIAIGAAVFYDHNIDSDLKRIGGSIDWVSPYTYFAVNYYEPLDGWRTGERLGYEERALRGVDVNVEQALWDSHWVLEASGGYWKGYDADNRQGEWQPAGSVGIRYYPLDYLSVYADYAYHHDHVDTDRFAVGVEFSYPGKHRGVSENEVDLWRPVKREKRILYAERKKRVTPTLTLTTNPADVNAGNTISLLITSDRPVPGSLPLSLIFSGQVTASDFMNGLLTQSVDANFNGGTMATVMIATARDADTRKTYTITLASGSNYRVGESTQVSGRIIPAGTAVPGTGMATPTLTLASDPADIAGGGTISLVVTSDIAVAGTLTLPLTISGQVAAGDFTDGLTQSVTANFNGGRTATVTITTIKDADAVETYTITLASGTGYTVGSDNTANGRIIMALPVLTLATDPAAVDPGSNISLVITSDEVIAGSLTLALTISDRGSSGLTAGYFTDGLTQSVSANFNGSTTATVTIGTVRLVGSAKTYTITLGGGTGYTVGRDSTAAGMINALTPSLTLATDPSAVNPGSNISLVINSDEVIAGSLTVALTISDRGSSGLVAGYFSNGLTQSVSANFNGGRTATVTIGTVRLGGSARTYTITLGGGTGYTVGSDNTADGTINQIEIILRLGSNPASVTAGEDISIEVISNIPIAAGMFTVSLRIINVDLSVNPLPNGITASDIDGSINTARDFNVNFNGGTTATATIGTVADSDSVDENYGVILSPVSRGTNIYGTDLPTLVFGVITAR